MVVGIPETAKRASSSARFPRGARKTMELSAGEAKVSYAESTSPRTKMSG